MKKRKRKPSKRWKLEVKDSYGRVKETLWIDAKIEKAWEELDNQPGFEKWSKE